MTEHTYRRKRHFLRVSLPKAARLFSSRAAKREPESDKFSSSPTSITRSSTGKGSGHRRLEDRRSISSFGTSASDEYIQRFPPTPEFDEELEFEIKRRQSSAIRARVTKYDQLHAKSKMSPPLMEIQEKPLSRLSEIYERVQSFEKLEAESKKEPGPSLEELRKRRANRPLLRSKSLFLPMPLSTL